MFQEARGQDGNTGLDEKPIPNSPRRNWEATGRLLLSVGFSGSLASWNICCLMPALSMFPAYCSTSTKWCNYWSEIVCSVKQSKISESPALLFHQSPEERIREEGTAGQVQRDWEVAESPCLKTNLYLISESLSQPWKVYKYCCSVLQQSGMERRKFCCVLKMPLTSWVKAN